METIVNISNLGVEELTLPKMLEVNGGSRLSWALGYLCGILCNIADAYSSSDEGRAVQQALLDFH